MSSHSTSRLTHDQDVALAAWRASALERMGYFSSVLFAMRYVNAPGLGTFAVDKHWRCYIDFAAVESKGLDWCAEALLHEGLHLWADHATAAQDMSVAREEQDLWNAACDSAINDDLAEAGCSSFEDDGILPEQFGEPRGLTPHHYMTVLRAKRGAKKNQHGEAGNSRQGPHSDDEFKGCGSGSGGEAWSGELSASDDAGGKGDAISEAEKDQVLIDTAAAIKDHVAKGRGSVPGGLVEQADKILAPSTTPWQQTLGAAVRGAAGVRYGQIDYSYQRPNRRRHSEVLRDANGDVRGKMIHPGPYAPTPTIEVIRDTSGSMSADDLAVVTREIEGIARRIGIRGRDLVVTDVDAKVHGSTPYKGASSIRDVKGRGGTDMGVGIESAANRRKGRPDTIVVLTDGGTPWPQEPVGIPVVAAIIGTTSTEALVPDWIKTVRIDPADT